MVINDNTIYLVFEFLPFDLKRYREKIKLEATMTPASIKVLMYQIVRGTAVLHSKRILHRDLKPQNILVDNSGIIKVADFGLARQYTIPIKKYTHEIVTVWYRAPEILLGSTEYTTAVDIWSLGCIMAELYTDEPLFPGDSEIDELFKIFQYRTSPLSLGNSAHPTSKCGRASATCATTRRASRSGGPSR